MNSRVVPTNRIAHSRHYRTGLSYLVAQTFDLNVFSMNDTILINSSLKFSVLPDTPRATFSVFLKDSNQFFSTFGYDISIINEQLGWVLWQINLCRLFNAKSIFM